MSNSTPSPGAHAPSPGDFEPIVARNLEVLLERRAREDAQLGAQERVAEAITRFAGSMKFVYLHLALFGGWIAWNVLPHPFPKFDPQLIVLAMWASVEAIFLSTFIMIAQNRQTKDADRRADLDLQVNLLAEHELSRLVDLVVQMAERMGIEASKDPELAMARRDVRPEEVLDQIETRRQHDPN